MALTRGLGAGVGLYSSITTQVVTALDPSRAHAGPEGERLGADRAEADERVSRDR
jgi:hypothetical protein